MSWRKSRSSRTWSSGQIVTRMRRILVAFWSQFVLMTRSLPSTWCSDKWNRDDLDLVSMFIKSLAFLVHQMAGPMITMIAPAIWWKGKQVIATRPAEQLDLMPLPSDSLKSLAFLVHQMAGPMITMIAAPAFWWKGKQVIATRPAEQLDLMPLPSDSLKSLAFLVHQMAGPMITMIAAPVIWWKGKQVIATRPAEQLDLMPLPSDSLKSVTFLIYQMAGPATIAPDEASRATWHHAFSIRFSQITCFPCLKSLAGRAKKCCLSSFSGSVCGFLDLAKYLIFIVCEIILLLCFWPLF